MQLSTQSPAELVVQTLRAEEGASEDKLEADEDEDEEAEQEEGGERRGGEALREELARDAYACILRLRQSCLGRDAAETAGNVWVLLLDCKALLLEEYGSFHGRVGLHICTQSQTHTHTHTHTYTNTRTHHSNKQHFCWAHYGKDNSGVGPSP